MWLKTKVLLWKSLQLRKRHWSYTIIEIIVPPLIFFFINYIRSEFSDPEKPKVTFIKRTIPSPVSETALYDRFIHLYTTNYFIYTPKTSETEQIMRSVSERLHIKTMNIAENEGEMIQKIKSKFNNSEGFSDAFGIVFKEIRKSHVFKYKIRNTKDVWPTDLLFPEFEVPGPMNSGSVYLNNGFLALQLSLDKAFINISTFDDKSINMNDYTLEVQSYPYAKYLLDSESLDLYKIFLPLFTVLSFLLMCSNTINRVVEEKDSGIKELMKMMGLNSWMIWAGWIIHNIFVYAISITAVTFISCFEIYTGKGLLFNYTNPLLLWIFLMMYMITGIFFCFAISSFFNRPLLALIAGIIIWLLSFNIPYIFLKPTTNIEIQTLLMLLPNVALTYAYKAISSLESQKKGLQLSTLFITGKGDNSFSVGFVLFMFIIECFLYGFIAWYMDSVMPGKYGVAKSINFLCKWSKNKTESNEMVPIGKSNSKLFEKPPNEYEVGISVQNLHKHFGNFHAVNGVNLDLYKGNITALLGHNGAGKTTTMSIITGLFSPSFGSVKVNGHDLFSNIDHFRDNLGLCPQHNLLFSYLTTLDHLIFFGMLKGMPMQEAKKEGLNLLKLLNILHKKNELVSKLSGGMKRKVSLAIALVGNPEILILDEPTSGMDPESRREMWDLLLSFRGSRTILITTHFMEEADVLGDRIAIMDHGKVKCYGTSLFLKKAYGTGYNLTIVKEEFCEESNLIAAIKEIIPEAEIRSSLTAQVIINLPNKYTDLFSDVFKLLEAKKEGFGIKGMGISCTTMEEVFLRAEHDVVDDHSNNESSSTPDDADSYKLVIMKQDDDSDAELSNEELENKQSVNNDVVPTFMPKYTYGFNLLTNQFNILMEKKIIYTYRRWIMTLVFAIVPILLGMLVMIFTYGLFNASATPKGLDVSLSTYKGSSVYYHVGDKSIKTLQPYFVAISKLNEATVNEAPPENNLTNDLLKMCEKDVTKYRTNLMIAGDFNETNSIVIYNSIAIHTPAIAVNLYSNALLQKLSGNTESYISTINEPIQLESGNVCTQGFEILIVFLWLTTFTSGLLFLVGYFIGLPLNERVSGIKHLQIMTKLSPIMYWVTNFIWDYFCYIIVVIFTLAGIYLFDEYHIFTDSNELGVFFTLHLIYGWSLIVHAYVYSFFRNNHTSSMLLFVSINYILGSIINSAMFLLKDLLFSANKVDPYNNLNLFRYVTLIFPYFSYSACIGGFLQIAWENHKCRICNSSDMAEECSSSTDSKQKSYFVFKSEENQSGILEETLFLFFSSILYITIILLFDYKIFARLHQFGFNAIVGTGISYKEDNEDPDISAERDKVDAAKIRSNDAFSPLLLVDDLVKKFSFKFTGVRGISFTVSSGECFGLLGVNGAGKTTTFRILTGDTLPSKGDASIQTDKLYKLSSDINQYVSMIGYCPQFDAINDQLTGKESLKLMAILRGIPPENTKTHVDKWIKLLGLEEHKDRLCGTYSGGNKRKLNTAMALIGDPPVVFLDEPTSGVDPVARRNLWQLLASSQREGQAVVLTSHSMDECEALCNRLTIMVDGVMKCIGNIQYLKNRYGQGFTIMITLSDDESKNVGKLKADVERQYTPNIHLKDEHQGLLHYHITDPHIPLSEIFGQMESIKHNYAIVEDYTVSDTTLEQVFIAFAKRQAVLNTHT